MGQKCTQTSQPSLQDLEEKLSNKSYAEVGILGKNLNLLKGGGKNVMIKAGEKSWKNWREIGKIIRDGSRIGDPTLFA